MITTNVLSCAIERASKSDVVRGKVSAVLYNNRGHIICSAHNMAYHGSARFRTIHAEEALLQKAFKIKAFERYGDKLNLLVLRYKTGTKEIAMAKPCPNCAKMIAKTKLQVFYSDRNGRIVSE